MRKFRRLCAMFAALVVVLGLLVMPISAEETEDPATPGEEIMEDVVGGENTPVDDVTGGGEAITPPETEEPTEDENDTLLARVWEFVQGYDGEIIGALSFVAAFVGAYLTKNGKGLLVSGMKSVVKGQNVVTESNAEVAASQKDIAEKQERLDNNVATMAQELAENRKLIAALLVEVMGLIEIQHIQTLNNANVPQAFKDLVTSKYARCLSTVNDDEELKATYDEMREKLGLGGNTDDEAWDD